MSNEKLSPIEQKIKEAIEEWREKLRECRGDIHSIPDIDSIAHRKANELWVSDEQVKRSAMDNAPEGKAEGYTKGARWILDKTPEQVIMDAIDRFAVEMFSSNGEYNTQELKVLVAKEKAQELPSTTPITSPSDLTVEVDGKIEGDLVEWTSDRYVVCFPSEPDGSPDFKFIHTHYHIRLLTPSGEVWMDNRQNQDQ